MAAGMMKPERESSDLKGVENERQGRGPALPADTKEDALLVLYAVFALRCCCFVRSQGWFTASLRETGSNLNAFHVS
jgi:hypothetical protein